MIIYWKGHSYTWQKEGNTWYTTVDARFVANTWRFGDIHQAKVLVDYDLKVDGKTFVSPLSEPYVGICLRPGNTRDEAMKICLDFIEEYNSTIPVSVEDTIKFCAQHYSDIYPNRASFIDHLFFTIGNGYDWLDGCLVNTSPHDHLELQSRKDRDKDLYEAMSAFKALMKETNKDYVDSGEKRRLRWEADVHEFYSVNKDYSNICQVPDDVKPDWLELAYEAALLLRDKSGVPNLKTEWYNTTEEDAQKRQQENRKIGAEMVAQLERRFPHVKKSQQIPSQETR